MDTSSDSSAVLSHQPDQYVGQWRRLVSTTNWEKGRIIAGWRQSAIQEQRRPTEYSDEAWARLVGGVSPQHVGRLRRVHERFGDQYESYAGLFWSHFHGALDWDDAEMWLEGAVQNRWSVSQMRHQRWETLGGDEPMETEIVDSELDEDLEVVSTAVPDALTEIDVAELRLVSDEEESANDRPDPPATASAPDSPDAPELPTAPAAFATALPPLPDDLLEAFDNLKVVVLRHKLDGWRHVQAASVMTHLDAVKQICGGP